MCMCLHSTNNRKPFIVNSCIYRYLLSIVFAKSNHPLIHSSKCFFRTIYEFRSIFCYFPMQKSRNTTSRIPSAPILPVILPISLMAVRSSSAHLSSIISSPLSAQPAQHKTHTHRAMCANINIKHTQMPKNKSLLFR